MAQRLSSGIVLIRYISPQEPRVLLLQAFNHWDFPKGMLEKDEDHLTAAKREVEEETTLSEFDFRWGYAYCETGPYAKGKIARYHIAECSTGEVSLPINPDLGRPEHHAHRWMDFTKARVAVRPRLYPVLDWAAGLLQIKLPSDIQD